MQDASSKQQTQQKYKSNHQQTGLPPHSALPIKGKTNKQKFSTHITLHDTYTNHWTKLRSAKTNGRNNSTFFKERIQLSLKPGKRRPQTQLLFKKERKKMKRQRNTAQMKEQTRNTEVQINEENIGKLLKKNSE